MSNFIDLSDEPKSSNFGDGLELLVNTKVRDNNRPIDINLDDITNLEAELNELSNMPSSSDSRSSTPIQLQFDEAPSVKFEDDIELDLGRETSRTEPDNRQTWDGYQKFSSIPTSASASSSATPQMNKEDVMREKYKYLRKLETLEKKGVILTKKYTLESPLSEMQAEFDMINEEKQRSNSIKFQSNMLLTLINGIEFINGKFDPFDIKLDGWSDQINENISDYDEIFGQLYEKYKSKPAIYPELKLLFQLGGSAIMVHMTNTMFKTEVPGIDDIFKQNPDLMRHFQSAAVNSMSQTNPGFAGFMNNIVGIGGNNTSPPPPPLQTQNHYSYDSNIRPGNNNSVPKRAEMKGPSDISNLLSSLKTKTVPVPQQNRSQQINDNSTISVSDLKDMQSSGNIPKKSKRRQSDRNTINLSLDI